MQSVELLRSILRVDETYQKYKDLDKQPNLIKFGNCDDLIQICNKYNPNIIIEVGSWHGNSALAFANYLTSIDSQIICVDTWFGGLDHWIARDYSKLDQQFDSVQLSVHFNDSLHIDNSEPNIYEEFLNNVAKSDVSQFVLPLRQTSMNAAKILSHFNITADLIFIDGSHEYMDCYNDLAAYWPLLNTNGVMVIDDLQFVTIKKAAEDFITENELQDKIICTVEQNKILVQKK